MSTPPIDHRFALRALTVASVLVVLYSLLIVQQPLLGVLAAGSLFSVYLLWRVLSLFSRFVRAHERIAAALEE